LTVEKCDKCYNGRMRVTYSKRIEGNRRKQYLRCTNARCANKAVRVLAIGPANSSR
jgi:hypothetical protein